MQIHQSSRHPGSQLPSACAVRPRPCLRRVLALLALLLCAGISQGLALTATPATPEGPYYTFSPQNQVVQPSSEHYAAQFFTTEGTDNDLTHIYSTSPQSSGAVYLLSGSLVNTEGSVISGATVELWEADNNGVYWFVSSSSGDNHYAARDQNFQGYGRTTTDSTGAWSFRTIKPALAAGRIRHFHLRVKINGTNRLTTQFFFNEDSESFAGDSVAAALVNAGTIDLVTLTTTAGTDGDGNPVLSGFKPLVIHYSTDQNSPPTITTQPASQTVPAGGSVTFSVVASSQTAVTYQWYKGDSAITDAKSSSYKISPVTNDSAGSYHVVVSNSAGSTTSAPAKLTVTPAATAPVITTQPVSQTVTAGSSVTFSVVASGSGQLTYQWHKGDHAITDAKSSSYKINAATGDNAGSYHVVVSNAVGSTTSATATLTVNSAVTAPTITRQPVSQTVTAGSSITFSVVASGSGPLTYQWYKGDAAINDAKSASYTIASATASSTGNYSVKVSNSAGSVKSSVATLTVKDLVTAPMITTQPSSQSVTAGSSVTFSVMASGSGQLTYQWYKGDHAISDARSAQYTIHAATADNAGSYDVVVANSAGSVTSATVTLTVTPSVTAPKITTQPVAQEAAIGASATFSVVATGGGTLSYQWYKNGSTIADAHRSSYTIPKVEASSAGLYSVVVSNSAGSVTSVGARLTVSAAVDKPVITKQPVSQSVAVGGVATFSVTVTGSQPLIYQWYKNDQAIAGATGSAYVIPSVINPDAGKYNVVVTNAVGSATSNKETLTVKTVVQPPATINVSVVGSGQLGAGTDTGKVVFTREGADLNAALTINLKVKGSAVYGTDYVTKDGVMLGNTLTFPAGAAKVTVKFKRVSDGESSGQPKTIVVKLLPGTAGGYTVGDHPKANLLVLDAG